MLEDDFLKERQSIREKMLKFSRAINQGKKLDNDLKEEPNSDDILRRRFKKNLSSKTLEELDKEYDLKASKKSNIYLKEDLINVKLEERQSLTKKILSKMKLNKKRKQEKNQKKIPLKKLNEFKNTQIKTQNQIKNHQNLTQLEEKKQNTKALDKAQKIKTKIEKSPSIQKKIIQNRPNIQQSLENLQKKMAQDTQEFLNTQKTIKQNDEDSQKIKNVLLEGLAHATKEDKNLNFNHLLLAYLLIAFTLFLFTPQIYIRNQIYYLSREIATLRTEENLLYEENKDLKRKLENMRFQNQILDYLE